MGLVSAVATLIWRRGYAQFAYELVMSLAFGLYFAAVVILAIKAAKPFTEQSELQQRLRQLSHALIAFFVPICVALAWLLFATITQ
jgi:hypothetical protein